MSHLNISYLSDKSFALTLNLITQSRCYTNENEDLQFGTFKKNTNKKKIFNFKLNDTHLVPSDSRQRKFVFDHYQIVFNLNPTEKYQNYVLLCLSFITFMLTTLNK